MSGCAGERAGDSGEVCRARHQQRGHESSLLSDAAEQDASLEREPCHSGKQSKWRLAWLLCINKAGNDKRDLLIIVKAENPRCFKGAKKLSAQYVSNTKAWMSCAVVSEWLKSNDDTGYRKRNVCLLLDNCTVHPILELHLQNVELRFFLPNATCVIQPLDQGIINSCEMGR